MPLPSIRLYPFYNMNEPFISLLGLKTGFCSDSTGVTRVTSLDIDAEILFSSNFENIFTQFYDKMNIYQCIIKFST